MRPASGPPHRIHFPQSVVEEECTGNGTLACLQRGYKADCAFVPEPLQPKLLLRAEIGLIWFAHVAGDPQHASGFTSTGANAIEKALALWPHIKALEDPERERGGGPSGTTPIYLIHPIPTDTGQMTSSNIDERPAGQSAGSSSPRRVRRSKPACAMQR